MAIESPERSKAAAIKCYVEAQTQIESGMRMLLAISPVVASSKPYEGTQKVLLSLRQLIAQINSMRVV